MGGRDLVAHLAGAGGVVPAPFQTALDEALDEEAQLQRHGQAVRLQELEARRQQAKILDLGRGAAVIGGALGGGGVQVGRLLQLVGPAGGPFGAQVVLDGEREGDQHADGALDVVALGAGERAVGVEGVDEDGAGQVAHGGVDGGQRVAAVPEAIVRGLVAEHEDEADDDGEGGDLEQSFRAQAVVDIFIQADNQDREQRVADERNQNGAVDGAFDEAQHERPSGQPVSSQATKICVN
ncbi:hypothetical protein LOY93_006885 [Ophidiomyces ophidiicola]|nr:hypothetical protein LOY93_006885 [Ophidiomyces ophidiicola]